VPILFHAFPPGAPVVFKPEMQRRFEALAGIGEMVADDLSLVLRGRPPQRLPAVRSGTVARWRNPPGCSHASGTRIEVTKQWHR